MPSQRELMHYIMQRWKENPEDGRFQFQLINCSIGNQMEFPARLSAEEFKKVLHDLDQAEIFHRVYAEGRLNDMPDKPEIGCLVLGHTRPNGKPGYYAVTVDDQKFLKARSYISIVPDSREEPGRVELLTPTGWKKIEAANATSLASVRIALATLRAHLDDVQPRKVHIRQIRVNKSTYGPNDPKLMRLLSKLIRKEIQITTGRTRLDNIEPFSVAFCMKISNKVSTSRIAQGFRPSLLVYWQDGKFVMSDDYLPFLAYRELKVEHVPVAILGDFPTAVVDIEDKGGFELLPPLGVTRHRGNTPALNRAFQEWLLDKRIREKNRRPIPNDLAAAWLVLAEILNDDQISEAEVQDYLLKFPPILAPSGKAIDSEVRLGKRYKIDIVIRSAGVTEDVSVLELENPNHDVFTRDGRPRKAVTHAKQQVEDWLRWMQEHPSDKFVQTLRGLPPHGLVVIGKSRKLNDEQRTRLAHLNLNSKVQVITYDELLDRFGDLILQQCDNTRQ